jgi:hypothetical protein
VTILSTIAARILCDYNADIDSNATTPIISNYQSKGYYVYGILWTYLSGIQLVKIHEGSIFHVREDYNSDEQGKNIIISSSNTTVEFNNKKRNGLLTRDRVVQNKQYQ